jgi:hypothetical protein
VTKILFLLLNVLATVNLLSQTVVVDSLKQEGWDKSGKLTFLVNQSAFSNWTSGGENSIAGAVAVDYNLNYFKNGWAWDTKMIGAFGMNKYSDSELENEIKTFISNMNIFKNATTLVGSNASFFYILGQLLNGKRGISLSENKFYKTIFK